jgi:hypothetical protein
MSQIDDANRRRGSENPTFHDADERIAEPEVGGQRD